jgi:hypothetical protein
MFRCRLEEDSIAWPKVWRGAALAHAQVFPVISFGASATETCESRRLPETTQRDVSPIDSARSRCIRLQTFIELPSVETFPGAACLPRYLVALDFQASQREIPHSRSKAAPLQAPGRFCAQSEERRTPNAKRFNAQSKVGERQRARRVSKCGRLG